MRIFFTCLILFALVQPNHSQQISAKEWIVTGSELGLALGVELFGKPYLTPDEPRFSNPNSFDRLMRNKLWSGLENQDNARVWSDRLIYGVSMSSLVWGPLLANNTNEAILINARVFAANSLLTNIVKMSAARERPYHHFNTRPSEGSKDFTSFYSGHSSVAFSQAVANAMILSRSYPEHDSMIWSTLLSAAGLTAYLRIAGDMHYFSDVITGAAMGSLVALTVTRIELNRFDKANNDTSALFKYQGTGSNFMVSFKIPLG
ncbi:MAG: phosphatase PAP2 family protein [Candidatus Marinimicrobia bacterium]|nr:phosphatase PAP2 family protein [Candidatus Neomarinimicrobiota bacterium]MCF7923407.1 phosphatase PAP2 family protein [Candidatus Neomarinimicrobiota bacterium]